MVAIFLPVDDELRTGKRDRPKTAIKGKRYRYARFIHVIENCSTIAIETQKK